MTGTAWVHGDHGCTVNCLHVPHFVLCWMPTHCAWNGGAVHTVHLSTAPFPSLRPALASFRSGLTLSRQEKQSQCPSYGSDLTAPVACVAAGAEDAISAGRLAQEGCQNLVKKTVCRTVIAGSEQQQQPPRRLASLLALRLAGWGSFEQSYSAAHERGCCVLDLVRRVV